MDKKVYRESIKELIRLNRKLKIELMVYYDRSEYIIDSWFRRNNQRLTETGAIDIITNCLGVNENELFE